MADPQANNKDEPPSVGQGTEPAAAPREITEPGAEQAPAAEPQAAQPAPPEPAPPEAAPTEPAPERPAPVVPGLNEKEVRRLSRRELLKLSPLVLAGAFVIPRLREYLLEIGVGASDKASGALFRRTHLAATFPDSMVVPFDKFPYNGYDVIDPEVDLDNWTLTVEGQVAKAGEYTLAQIQSLPKIVENTRHVCVEGWDVIGSFGGARVSDFLRLIGADVNARYLEVECADDYYESIDMPSVLHPQSLLCYEMYGNPLDRGHGAPLRLRLPVKLGYKSAKYLTTFRVTNVLRPDKRGYWEDQGYAWHAGL